MDVTLNTKEEQHAYPKVEQLYPEFNMLYRGSERLGVLLYVKGIKVYYFSFEANKRYAIYEKALFKNEDVRLGKFKIDSFPQLIGLMKNDSLSSPTFSPCRSICSSSSTSLNSLRSIYSDIESHSNGNLIQYATEKIRLELQDAVNAINDNVRKTLEESREQSRDQLRCIEQMKAKIGDVEKTIELIARTTINSNEPESDNISKKMSDVDSSGTLKNESVQQRQFEVLNAAREQRGEPSTSNATMKCRSDRGRIAQYFKEGKAYTGAPLRTRGRRNFNDNGKQVKPRKPLVLQPYRGKSAMLTDADAIPFFRHYKGKPGPDILDAELRYIAHKPEAVEFIKKIEPYVTGDPCPIETMDVEQFVKELFKLLIESQLLRPF